MTAADQIAAELRDAFRRLLTANAEAHVITRAAIRAVYEANEFDSAMSRALAAIVALDDAEAAAAAEVRAAQARMAIVTEASAKAREALRQAMDACGGPGATEAESEFHKARLQRGGAKVDITDEKALPADCWRVKREPDKALIKALLAKGQAIPGAALVQSPPTLHISAKDKS